MTTPTTIDVRMHGIEGLTAAFVVAGRKTALVETGPQSSLDALLVGLQEAGVDHVDVIVVTHVHLDHAGAAGTLAGRWPDAEVAVHEVGAPHLVDPSKLWSSATRIYGDAMEGLWGGIDPVPEERVRALADGDVVDLGGRTLRAVATPGHAYHHHAFADDATGALFCGDALGVLLQDVRALRPATPPPELDLDAAAASIERIRKLAPESLWPTHFGRTNRPVDEVCSEALQALRKWEGWVREARGEADGLDAVTKIVASRARADLEDRLSQAALDRLEQTTSYRMNVWGYMRYLDRHGA